MNKFNKLSSGKHFIPININGYWESKTDVGHHFDEGLYNTIKNFFFDNNIKTAVDFGCGTAEYVRKLSELDFVCEAYDGNPNTYKITNGFANVLDLTQDINLNKTYHCVISLEVGEHIPNKYEENYINNLRKHCKKHLILSWAIENQLGDGHVNCHNNDYVIEKLSKLGFKFDDTVTKKFRDESVLSWFKNTILIFNL